MCQPRNVLANELCLMIRNLMGS